MKHQRASFAVVILAVLVSPAVVQFTIYAPGSSYTPSPPEVFAVPGVTVSVPLYLAWSSTGTGRAISCDVQLRFDTTALEIPNLSTDITAGSLDPNWTIATYSPSPGVVNILSFADQPITVPPSGTVLNILFQVLSAGPWAIGLADYNGTGYDYQSGSITPTGLGNANLDGRVDINDLTIVLSHYNQTGMTWTEGEFTGDGTVDINDLTIVLANYNKTYGASLGAGNAVPEPTSLILLAVAVMSLLLLISKNRHRQRV